MVGESASSRVFTGSSTIKSSAGFPVMPERSPRAIIRPRWPLSSNSPARLTFPMEMPNTSSPSARSFSRLRRQKRSANSSEYPATMTRLSGQRPKNQLGRVSVTAVDFPCWGGVSMSRMS